MLADETFDALVRGDEEFFVQVFPTLFQCAFLAMARLIRADGDMSRGMVVQMSPVKDLLDLSGYGLLFSALDGKNFEATVRRCWDDRFAHTAGGPGPSALIATLTHIAEPSLWQDPGARLRTRWHYGTERALRGRGIIGDQRRREWDDDESVHPQALVRAYARSLSVLFEAHDIFLSRYLYVRPEAASLVKPAGIRNFDAEFARENQANANA